MWPSSLNSTFDHILYKILGEYINEKDVVVGKRINMNDHGYIYIWYGGSLCFSMLLLL